MEYIAYVRQSCIDTSGAMYGTVPALEVGVGPPGIISQQHPKSAS